MIIVDAHGCAHLVLPGRKGVKVRRVSCSELAAHLPKKAVVHHLVNRSERLLDQGNLEGAMEMEDRLLRMTRQQPAVVIDCLIEGSREYFQAGDPQTAILFETSAWTMLHYVT